MDREAPVIPNFISNFSWRQERSVEDSKQIDAPWWLSESGFRSRFFIEMPTGTSRFSLAKEPLKLSTHEPPPKTKERKFLTFEFQPANSYLLEYCENNIDKLKLV